MTRLVDRGAITAAYVGIGMAVVITISFLLVIPIEPVIWYLALPAGLLIGYYANVRSAPRGRVARTLANGAFAGAVTGVTLAALLLATKAIFFAADTGFPDFNLVDATGAPVSATCSTGVDCVYERYLASGRADELAAAGIDGADAFGRFYWSQQLAIAGLLVGLTTAGGLGGAALHRLFGGRGAASPRTESRPVA